jgi:uncharacterized short protein YbdD (DUF466 family)
MKLFAIFERVWAWLRAVTGDAAYENYLRHRAGTSPDSAVLSPREFYLDVLRRRYNTVNRCC